MTKLIIVCDDEAHITRAVSMKLTRGGYHVETFPDGQAAWEFAQAHNPSLLVTDYQMPRMDGFQLCTNLRQHETLKDLPVIMLTAKGYEFDQQQMIDRFGLSYVLFKPFSPRELLQNVEMILGKTSESEDSTTNKTNTPVSNFSHHEPLQQKAHFSIDAHSKSWMEV